MSAVPRSFRTPTLNETQPTWVVEGAATLVGSCRGKTEIPDGLANGFTGRTRTDGFMCASLLGLVREVCTDSLSTLHSPLSTLDSAALVSIAGAFPLSSLFGNPENDEDGELPLQEREGSMKPGHHPSQTGIHLALLLFYSLTHL
ncbi:hypothetical protein KQX54_002681 [Cotesia glomerata]|uniref:Uncharacterized protein n=1 Tax=Cotesia glomerata TaxID=32391 RepID=A0AAV7J5M3_COTGL|nr:hypothetical protein KQX54_002681 [Cotesia glomerata]